MNKIIKICLIAFMFVIIIPNVEAKTLRDLKNELAAIKQKKSQNDSKKNLTKNEFQIMEYFFSNPGQILSREDILNHVWEHDQSGDEKIVDVNVRRLRMKIEDDPSHPTHIVTAWGSGYKWQN